MTEAAFEYANLTGRPPGALVRTLGRVLPGVSEVQRQVQPYARAWREANVAALAGTHRRWIVFGDSMSQGIGASGPFHGWVSQAHEGLAARGIELDVVNLSASGAFVTDLLEQQLPAWRALPESSDERPDVVTVLVGSNDLISRRQREIVAHAFGRLLDQLPTGAIVATLPQPRPAARAVNERIDAAAAARGIRALDMRRSGPASWRGKLAADHFHPNDLGYRGIAEAFVPYLVQAGGTA